MVLSAVPAVVATAFGANACSDDLIALVPFGLLFALYISVAIRFRRLHYRASIKERKIVRRESNVGPGVPYEVLGAIVLSLVRASWAYDNVSSAITQHGALQYLTIKDVAAWGLLCWMVLFDVAENVAFRKLVLRRYYQVKEAKVSEAIKNPDEKMSLIEFATTEDVEQAQPVVETATESKPRRNLRSRFLACFRPKCTAEPTARTIILHYQMTSFVKASCVFIFLSEVALSACTVAPEHVLDASVSIAPALLVLSAYNAVILMVKLIKGARFARKEGLGAWKAV